MHIMSIPKTRVSNSNCPPKADFLKSYRTHKTHPRGTENIFQHENIASDTDNVFLAIYIRHI